MKKLEDKYGSNRYPIKKICTFQVNDLDFKRNFLPIRTGAGKVMDSKPTGCVCDLTKQKSYTIHKAPTFCRVWEK